MCDKETKTMKILNQKSVIITLTLSLLLSFSAFGSFRHNPSKTNVTENSISLYPKKQRRYYRTSKGKCYYRTKRKRRVYVSRKRCAKRTTRKRTTRKYRKGTRGRCFYYRKGKKVYVSRRLCR